MMLFLYFLILLLIATYYKVGSTTSENIGNDLSLFRYTKDGDIAQIKYTSKAIEKVSPKLCFHDQDTDCIVLLSFDTLKKSILSIPMIHSNSKSCTIDNMKVHIDNDLGYMFALIGYIPDCEYLLNYMDTIIQNHCLIYGESPNIEYLTSHISTWITRGLYRANKNQGEDIITRPLATSIILSSTIPEYCEFQNKYQHKLWQVDCTGLITQRKFSMIGTIPDNIQEQIQSILSNNINFINNNNNDNNNNSNNNETHEYKDKTKSLIIKINKLLELFIDKIDDIHDDSYKITCCLVIPTINYSITDTAINSNNNTSKITSSNSLNNNNDCMLKHSRIVRSTPMGSVDETITWIQKQFNQ